MVDIPLLLLIPLVVLSAFTHGFCGFGFGIVLIAALSFCTAGLERSALLVTFLAFLVTGGMGLGIRKGQRVDRASIWILLAGIAAGVPLGYAFVCRFDQLPPGRLIFALVLLFAAAQGFFRPGRRLDVPPWSGVLFGMAGGFLSGAYASGGPPLVYYLYFREEDPRVAKRTLQVVFVCMGLVRLTIVLLGPRGVPLRMLWLTLVLAPAVLGGTWLGHHLSRKTSNASFSRIVYALLAIAGTVQLHRAVVAIMR